MPLLKGKSKKAFGKNVETEMEHGKPQKQALAIAFKMKQRSKKMAEGGKVGGMDPSDKDDKMMAKGGEMKSKRERALEAFHGKMMAEGGMIDGHQASGKVDTRPDLKDHEGDSGFVSHKDCAKCNNDAAMSEDKRSLGEHGAHEEGEQGGGQGFHGESFEGNPGDKHDEYQSEAHDEDMVGHIMKQRQQHFSKGGEVANEDHGHNDDKLAGFSPNEFDDLSLRDDLEESETAKNSGDEDGDAREDKDRNDIISQIMKSRKKKDRLPNPA